MSGVAGGLSASKFTLLGKPSSGTRMTNKRSRNTRCGRGSSFSSMGSRWPFGLARTTTGRAAGAFALLAGRVFGSSFRSQMPHRLEAMK